MTDGPILAYKPGHDRAARHERVLIVDFGSQVTQLIARRVRESGVYCEIHPYDKVDGACWTPSRPRR